ncbi:aspartic proteinase PCS1 [Diospyros lotus]|uniref:aspartic proteinase PCS1 n=1 Tax=Diospyros lotus TaxID=55363 RepID=UPI00224F7E5D|nr:aspartic proteinase PCS1 [Diospyros lotus]
MALCNSILLLLLLLLQLSLSTFAAPETALNNSVSFSFPLTSVRLSSSTFLSSSLLASTSPAAKRVPSSKPSPHNYRSVFKYSMALIVSLPIGTPPQTQQMVLDTGSQLSWIQCHPKRRPPPTASFDPSLSSSFSVLPCNHPICKPRVPDFTLPTSCDQNRLCHYSYFYADGTLAEGNLVREKFTFSPSQSTPPLTLGCATDSSGSQGILGMNLGRLSFASQAKISKFSYCVPPRQTRNGVPPTGGFYLGPNPNSHAFRYVNLLTFPQSRRMPNLDPLAFTLPMVGIRIGAKRLNISASAFRPSAGGAGQTMIDSGSEFTYLVDEAYSKVRDEIVKLAGPKLKKGYVYEGALDMCFEGDAAATGWSIGDLVFEFEKGAEIVVERERVLVDVGGGVHCLGIGRSDSLAVPSNIIGNIHQQDLWVEYDLTGRRVGFGKADCSRSVK